MLRLRGRLACALASASAIDVLWVTVASAEASFVPGVSPETPVQASPDPMVIPLVVLGAAILALVVVARVPSRRGAVGVVLGALAFLFGGVLVAAGLFGDLSGQHRVFVVPLVAGLAFMAVAAFGLWRLRRGPADTRSDRPIA